MNLHSPSSVFIASSKFLPRAKISTSARIIPIPASLVPVPPSPIMKLRQPRFMALDSNSPTPYVVARIGLRSSSFTRFSPHACATSIIAVPSGAMPYWASTRRIIWSWIYTGSNVPPRAAVKAWSIPSPPSDIGRQTVSIPSRQRASANAVSTSTDDRHPLNESMARMYFMSPPPRCQSVYVGYCLFHCLPLPHRHHQSDDGRAMERRQTLCI